MFVKNLKQPSPEVRRFGWLALGILSLFLVVLGISLYHLPPGVTLTEEEHDWLQNHPIIRLAPNPDYPPLEYYNDQNQYAGMIVDYFKIIERNLGIRIEYVHYPSFDTAIQAVRAKELDGLTAAQTLAPGEKDLVQTTPIINIPDVIITKKYIGPLSFQGMEGWTLAITRGYPSIADIHRIYPYITISETSSDLEALQLVSVEQADAALVNQAVASYLIGQNGISQLRIAGNGEKVNSFCITIRADEPELASILQKGLNSITGDEKSEINRKWIALADNNSPQSRQIWTILFWAIAAVTIILALSLFWSKTLQQQVAIQTEELNKELAERTIAENRLNEQIQNMSALRAIGVAINSSMDLPLTLDILLDQVISKLHVDACNILLQNPSIRTLDNSASKGFRAPFLRGSILKPGTNSFAWKAILSRKTITENLLEDKGPFSDSSNFADEEFVQYIGAPLISKGAVKGVLEVFNRSVHPIDQGWLDFLEAIASQAAIAIDNASMLQSLQRANLDLTLAYDATIEGWAKALELRDGTTEDHSRRVIHMTLDLAARMGFSNEELIHIRRGALLHDIGKMAIPDRILQKPGPLTPEEWEIMKMHPVYAHDMLKNVQYLIPALDIPYCHHEHWDGSGYPQGLRGESIPLAARVFSIIDVWDALTSDRPYRKAWSNETTLQYIQAKAGTQFDPSVVAEFLKNPPRA